MDKDINILDKLSIVGSVDPLAIGTGKTFFFAQPFQLKTENSPAKLSWLAYHTTPMNKRYANRSADYILKYLSESVNGPWEDIEWIKAIPLRTQFSLLCDDAALYGPFDPQLFRLIYRNLVQ